jgi:hypothetical protein
VLLRFLQDQTYLPVGSRAVLTADIRIIAASNANLHDLVERGQFRRDLLFRLRVLQLHLPPLRDRAGDVTLLAHSFLERLSHTHQRQTSHSRERLPESRVQGRRARSSEWLERRAAFRALPRPMSADLPSADLFSAEVRAPWRGPPKYGVTTRDVPLLVLPRERLEFDYGAPIDADARELVDSLGLLATTQTGFMPPAAPDFRFPDVLNEVSRLCDVGSTVYSHEDEHAFRMWLRWEIEGVISRVSRWDDEILRAKSLPLQRQEMLMVPLIYLNHMWRQGSPTLPAPSGPSAMPVAFDTLLSALAETTGILPRFNQLVMTMRAWRIEGLPVGAPVSYRDLTDLHRVYPYFWLNGVSHTEQEFYRAFWTIESFGVPVYGWGCLALECAAADDAELGAFALRCVHGALRNAYFAVRHLVPHVDPVGFRKIQLTGGWVNDELNGAASGYQLPFMLMLDALFLVDYSHPGATDSRANGLRFVPERWKSFFRSLSARSPGLRSWVIERQCPELTDAYQRCIELLVVHRTMHRHLAGQTLRGATTTARTFPSSEINYRDFMSEMGAIVQDTAAVNITSGAKEV